MKNDNIENIYTGDNNKEEQELLDEQELLNLVKGYLATYVDKILEEDGASGIIASLLKEYNKDVHELREQVEELKKQIEDLKTTIQTLMSLGTDGNDYNPWRSINSAYEGVIQ